VLFAAHLACNGALPTGHNKGATTQNKHVALSVNVGGGQSVRHRAAAHLASDGALPAGHNKGATTHNKHVAVSVELRSLLSMCLVAAHLCGIVLLPTSLALPREASRIWQCVSRCF
jgi:hypothetical protein